MADQKHWWKLHSSALTDDKILALTPADRWCWAALATHTREHGDKGRLVTDRQNPFLALIFGCDKSAVMDTIKRLPNVRVEESENCNSKISLQFVNWNKYAEDNSLHRVQKHRAEKKRNATEERRGEEKQKRGEENKNNPSSGAPKVGTPVNEFSPSDLWILRFLETQTFVNLPPAHLKALQNPDFWERTSEACGGISLALLQTEFAKMGNWLTDNPSRVPTAKGIRRFVSGWLERAYEKERRYGGKNATSGR